jgi:acyl-coenzyme A thioesterase PaaI-like protein
MSREDREWPSEVTKPVLRHPDAPAPGTELEPHYVNCFGCGPGTVNGLRMTSAAGAGVTVHAEFTVGDGHQGAPGLAHGGLLAAAFDETLGSLAALYRIPAVTGTLETTFRRPVPVGSTLYITATGDGIAGRKIYCSANGHLGTPEGPVAVRARAVFISVSVEHFLAHGRTEDVREVFGDRAAESGRFEVNP